MALDIFGNNCQRIVFSLGVSHHIHNQSTIKSVKMLTQLVVGRKKNTFIAQNVCTFRCLEDASGLKLLL